nr:hypothetical protein Iba_chr04bCG16140 [Ipomoea batatas]
MSSSSVGWNLDPTSSELRGSNTVVDHSNRKWLSSLLPVFLTPMSSPQFLSLFSRIGVKLVKWFGARFGQGWCNVSNERVTLAACPPIGFGASNPSVKYKDNT